MSRKRTPDHELTPEQLKKRAYNEKYRYRMNEKSNEKKHQRIIEKKPQRVIEKKALYAMASNGSTGDFSNVERETSQSDFSNVFSIDSARRGRVEREISQSNFSNELLNQLREENEKLREELEVLKSRRVGWRKSLLSLISALMVLPIPALLVWQMKEMIELVGNRGGLVLAGGLEYAVILAAGAAGLARNTWEKTLGTAFVIGLTAVMALFVISGIGKRDLTGSETFKRLSEERTMLVSDRAMLQDQMEALPTDYKTKRAEFQDRIEDKTKAISSLGDQLDTLQKSGGDTDPLAKWANILSRILLMLL